MMLEETNKLCYFPDFYCEFACGVVVITSPLNAGDGKGRVLAGESYFHIVCYMLLLQVYFVPSILQIIPVILCENMADSLSRNIPFLSVSCLKVLSVGYKSWFILTEHILQN